MIFTYKKLMKWFAIVSLLFIGLLTYSYVMRLHMPQIPFDGVSKYTLYHLGQKSSHNINLVQKDTHNNWYIFKGNAKTGEELLTELLHEKQYRFIDQMGAALIYIHNNDTEEEQFIVTSQQWSRNFILYKIPNEVEL